MKFEWSCGALADGLECYRREAFFSAHEHWETVWLQSQEPEKTFLQALIQLTAAFHHVQRKNAQGATSLLKAALRRLEPYPAFFGGIALEPLRDDMRLWIRLLETHDALLHRPFPQICLSAPPSKCSCPRQVAEE